MTAARWFGEANAVLSLYCQGLNQSSSGTAKNAALINLHLATGQIGRPGAGPFSLTGQPNAMGGREVGGMATLMSGHRDLANAAAPRGSGGAVGRRRRARQSRARRRWKCSPRSPPATSGWSGSRARTPRSRCRTRRAFARDSRRAELVVLQEAYTDTETAAFADVLLPATTWGEKDGTVTNSERRISRVRSAVPGPGEARDDWSIAVDFARRLEARLKPSYLARVPHAVSRIPRPRRYFASMSRRPPGATSTSRAFRTRCSTPAARSSGRFRPAPTRAGSGSMPTACSRRRTAARASPTCRTCPSRKSRTRAIRFASTPAACATSGTG